VTTHQRGTRPPLSRRIVIELIVVVAASFLGSVAAIVSASQMNGHWKQAQLGFAGAILAWTVAALAVLPVLQSSGRIPQGLAKPLWFGQARLAWLIAAFGMLSVIGQAAAAFGPGSP
jgi:hypothetical protein